MVVVFFDITISKNTPNAPHDGFKNEMKIYPFHKNGYIVGKI